MQTRIRFAGLLPGLISAAVSLSVSLKAGPTNSIPMASQKGAETPEKLISRISGYCLAGDSTNLLLCFDTSTSVHEVGAKSFAVSIELAKAKADLRDALVKKFGAEKFATLKGNYVMPMGFDPLRKISDAFKKPDIHVDGDTASVTFGMASQVPLKLEREGGRWLMVRDLAGMASDDLAEAFDNMEANRYYTLGVRDAIKLVAEMKTFDGADKRIDEAINKQVGIYLAQPEMTPGK